MSIAQNAPAASATSPASPASNPPSSGPGSKKKPEAPPPESTRDTIESIIFALLMAFLFRTFEAEAFVIPTGSMAPTLYGRHKELSCEHCGFRVVVGASEELTKDGLLEDRLTKVVCQNCGGLNDAFDLLPFNGDRILVNKYPYEFGEPDRWDVFVFKNPDQPDMNYIKRLVGLPGETVRIRQGDLYKVVDGTARILRKPPEKQKLLQIPVYDDRHPPRTLLKAGWPERWAAMQQGGPEDGAFGGWTDAPASGWKHDPDKREFRLESGAAEPAWLRYRHYYASPIVWSSLADGKLLPPVAQLIADNCGYNNFVTKYKPPMRIADLELGAYWVNDLTLNCEVEVESIDPGGALDFELCEGAYSYRCRVDLSSGIATLSETSLTGNVPVELGSQGTRLKGPGTYDVSFSCVDDRLSFWINGTLVDFGPKASLEHFVTSDNLPHSRDLTPVGIAAKGTSVRVRDLLLERDVYYRTAETRCLHGREDELARLLDNVEGWGQLFQSFEDCEQRDIEVDANGFLALGDNSPRSSDSRFWDKTKSVSREYLVGKAFWIYWPHGIPFLNDGRGYTVLRHSIVDNPQLIKSSADYPKMTAPFYPQFPRMKRIR